MNYYGYDSDSYPTTPTTTTTTSTTDSSSSSSAKNTLTVISKSKLSLSGTIDDTCKRAHIIKAGMNASKMEQN